VKRLERLLFLAGRVAGQCLLLWLVYQTSGLLLQATGLSLPQNLVGLLLLLLLLSTGVLRTEQLAEVSGLVSKHLVFFFIPLVVGLMSWTDLFAAHGLVLAVSICVSAFAGIVVAGLLAQLVSRWNARTTQTSQDQ
jgi:holin-like protein